MCDDCISFISRKQQLSLSFPFLLTKFFSFQSEPETVYLEENILCVTCDALCVTFHLSPVTCHLSPVTYQLMTTLCSFSCYESPKMLDDANVGILVIDRINAQKEKKNAVLIQGN